MESGGSAGTRIVRIVDAPSAFVDAVRTLLPDCDITSGASLPLGADGDGALVILYVRGRIDRSVLSEFAAQVPTVVVSESADPDEPLAALDAGADGYLDASISEAALRSALLGVLENEVAYARDVLGRWLRSRRRDAAESAALLSERQREILELIASGATDKEIAAVFGLRTTTVQKQVARLLRRIGARNRAAAVAVRVHVNGGSPSRH